MVQGDSFVVSLGPGRGVARLCIESTSLRPFQKTQIWICIGPDKKHPPKSVLRLCLFAQSRVSLDQSRKCDAIVSHALQRLLECNCRQSGTLFRQVCAPQRVVEHTAAAMSVPAFLAQH